MTAQEKALHIDIPVKLTEVKNVFSVASLSFEGDLPASIFHLQLIMNDVANWNAKSQVVVVFHTNASQHGGPPGTFRIVPSSVKADNNHGRRAA